MRNNHHISLVPEIIKKKKKQIAEEGEGSKNDWEFF